jgi:cholesterol 25-hydroxylase
MTESTGDSNMNAQGKQGLSSFEVLFWRVLFTVALCGALWRQEDINQALETTYTYLLSSVVFCGAFFETLWVPVVSVFIYAVPFIMDRTGIGSRYKLHSDVKWVDAGVLGIVRETIEYCVPLLILDATKAKSYPGVDPDHFKRKTSGWLQLERALPDWSPTLGQVVLQMAGAFVLFDVGFYQIHSTLHSNQWLYKHLHAFHHDHGRVHTRVTNKLHVVERLAHILVANYALKAMGAHPLSRTLFVPLFVGWLMYNHSGYDIPWMPDHLIPWGVASGSREHMAHHDHGKANYQPFFTYIDRYMSTKKKKTA